MDYFVIGLGNPGSKYEKTRHNVAWIILAEIFSFNWEYDKYLEAEYVAETLAGKHVHYLLPQTFMNKSGQSVAGLKKCFQASTRNILWLFMMTLISRWERFGSPSTGGQEGTME